MLLFCAKKHGIRCDEWVGGWMDGRAGLKIAYSNKKYRQNKTQMALHNNRYNAEKSNVTHGSKNRKTLCF